MTIRLSKEHYIADINALRARIRLNGRNPIIERVEVVSPFSPKSIYMHINLACRALADNVALEGSLYANAFENQNGIWYFTSKYVVIPVGRKAFSDKQLDGSYNKFLGTSAFPKFNISELGKSFDQMFQYKDQKIDLECCISMVKLIIVVCEALRFNQVRDEVDAMLGGGIFYSDKDLLHNWNMHLPEVD